MEISKLEGIKLLKELNIPTVELIDIKNIIKGETSIENGISVRLSPRDKNLRWNVGLPSINRRTDINEVREFVNEYNSAQYDIFAHETVRPEEVGTISRLYDNLIIETYKDYNDKHDSVIKNRVTLPAIGEKLLVSKLEMYKNNVQDFNKFREVIMYLRNIPFDEYEAEYVIQDGNVIFMDFTVANRRDNELLRHSYKENERQLEF